MIEQIGVRSEDDLPMNRAIWPRGYPTQCMASTVLRDRIPIRPAAELPTGGQAMAIFILPARHAGAEGSARVAGSGGSVL
jgi:hypothetical protein